MKDNPQTKNMDAVDPQSEAKELVVCQDCGNQITIMGNALNLVKTIKGINVHCPKCNKPIKLS